MPWRPFRRRQSVNHANAGGPRHETLSSSPIAPTELPGSSNLREILHQELKLASGRTVHLGISLGDITQAQADAIVRPAGYLGEPWDGFEYGLSGGVEKAIYRSPGGPAIFQQMLEESDRRRAGEGELPEGVRQFGARLGDIIITDAPAGLHGLKKIIHVMCHRSDKNPGDPLFHAIDQTAIIGSVNAVLNATDGMETIYFPVFGGAGGVTARAGFETLREGEPVFQELEAVDSYFRRQPKNSTVKSVNIVIYPREGFQTVEDIERRLREARRTSPPYAPLQRS